MVQNQTLLLLLLAGSCYQCMHAFQPQPALKQQLLAHKHASNYNFASCKKTSTIITNHRHASFLPRTSTGFALHSSDLDDEEALQVDSKTARMRALAAKLRAEAAQLEVEQKQYLVEKLKDIFDEFDTNKDGEISVEELKNGLSRALRAAINEEQAQKILKQFDTSGDGALQLQEFQNIEIFRRKFDKILQEEKMGVQEAREQARQAVVAASKAEFISNLINNAPPSASDRILSILPLILPILDSLPYGKSLIADFDLQSNPIVDSFAFLYLLYQTIPFSGLIAFFLFNSLSSNLRLNRLVRYNIQLAIFLDIALIIPGILITTISSGGNLFGFQIPPDITNFASMVTFVASLSVSSYVVVSSLLGKEVNYIPLISDRIRQRVPTTEEFQRMYEDFERIADAAEKAKKKQEEDDKNNKDKDKTDKK